MCICSHSINPWPCGHAEIQGMMDKPSVSPHNHWKNSDICYNSIPHAYFLMKRNKNSVFAVFVYEYILFPSLLLPPLLPYQLEHFFGLVKLL